MGTRSLILILYNGRFVVAQYTQYDGYPEREGQGLRILNFLLVPTNIQHLKDGLPYIYIPSNEERQRISAEVKDLNDKARAHADFQRSNGHYVEITNPLYEHWPSLSRDTGAGILEIIAQATEAKPVPVILDLEFANDGLFCEWAYVVNLDENTFEVFSGSEKKVGARSIRFHDIGGDNETVPILVKSFQLGALPETEESFIAELNQELEIIHKEHAAKIRKARDGRITNGKATPTR